MQGNSQLREWLTAINEKPSSDNKKPLGQAESQGILSGKCEATKPKTKYSFAGARSQTADHSMLAKARKMEEDGKDSETIRKKTGWFKGYS